VFSCDLREEVDKYLRKTLAGFATLAEIVAFNEAHPEYIPYGQERLYEAAGCPLSADEIAELAATQRELASAYLEGIFREAEVDLLISVDDLFALQYALAGNPAITIPRGLTGSGVPSGLTLIAPYLMDRDLIGYAFALEQRLEGRVPPGSISAIMESQLEEGNAR
jgi:amidase